METVIRSIKELDIFASNTLAALFVQSQNNPSDKATMLGLSGDLGAGKTAFVQALARALFIEEQVTSPTFVIARFYPLPHNKTFMRLVHMDAYRIEDASELPSIGWEEIIADPRNLVVVEWPEKIASQFPSHARNLFFEVVDETTRKISTRE